MIDFKKTIRDGLKEKKTLSKRKHKLFKYIDIACMMFFTALCSIFMMILPAILQQWIVLPSKVSLGALGIVILIICLSGIEAIYLFKEACKQINPKLMQLHIKKVQKLR